MSGAATKDSRQALASLDRIEALDSSLILSGHGEPWTQGTAEAVRRAREAGGS